MNEDILKGKWKQIRGEAKAFWGKLTNDDLDQVEGNADKLAGLLQERYGYTKQDTQKEISKFLDTVKAKLQEKTQE